MARGLPNPSTPAIEPAIESRPSFTLRFGDRETHETLRLVAEEIGTSMNRLAEEFIASGLRVTVLGLEERLSETLAALRTYRGEALEDDLAAFARAEADVDDPIATRLLSPEASDPLGIGAIFAEAVD